MSRLEIVVQEKKGVGTTQAGGVSQGDSEEIHSLQQQLATQGQKLATQIQENRELASRIEGLSTVQASLQLQNQQLTTQLHQQQEVSTQLETHFQQQLTDQLAEQRRVIQEEIQQQFQSLLQQVQSVHDQPSWSIAQDHLQNYNHSSSR